MTRIILTDDPSSTRDRLANSFGDAEVHVVSSGWELLEQLAEAEPDVVVTDLRMSFPDGLTVATLVRGAGLKTPFVVAAGVVPERAKKVAAGLGDVTLIERASDEAIVAAAHRAAERGATTEAKWVGAVWAFDDSDS